MEELLLLIVVTYGVSFVLGYLLQRYLRIPWMFAALFFGMALSPFGFIRQRVEGEEFHLLATLGMLVILFMIGLNLDLEEIKALKRKIFLGTASIMFLEGIFGSLLLYLGFPEHVGGSFLIALITAFSFATVGEAVLLPILAEFKLLDTTFGQLTLGIGTVDDVLEVLMLAVIAVVPAMMPKGGVGGYVPNPILMLLILGGMILLVFISSKWRSRLRRSIMNSSNMLYLPSLLILLIFFSFVAVGGFVAEELATVGAILGGIMVQEVVPRRILKDNENAINFMGYAFLSPLFFLSVGTKVSLMTIFIYPLLTLLISLVTTGSKLLASFLLFHRSLGGRCALLLGLGLTVRFSTSLIVQFILLNSGYISLALYSALIATAVLVNPIVIGAYAWGLTTSGIRKHPALEVQPSKRDVDHRR